MSIGIMKRQYRLTPFATKYYLDISQAIFHETVLKNFAFYINSTADWQLSYGWDGWRNDPLPAHKDVFQALQNRIEELAK